MQLTWQRIMAVGAIAIAMAAILELALELLGPVGAPVYFRILFWPDSLHFLLLVVAGLALALAGILFHYDYIPRVPGRVLSNRTIVSGFVLGLGLAAVLSTEVSRPVAFQFDLHSDPTFLPAVETEALAIARENDQPILYYFHADWCESCPEFERFVLGNPGLHSAYAPYLKVKIDATDQHRWGDYLERQYGVVGLPAVAIRGRDGELVPAYRFVGTHLSLLALKGALLRGAAQ